MVLEIADIQLLPGKNEEFEAAIEHGLRTIHTRAKGMRGYQVVKCVETPERYMLLVKWDSIEDHMVGYRESELSPQFRAMVLQYFAQPPVVQHFNVMVQGGGWDCAE